MRAGKLKILSKSDKFTQTVKDLKLSEGITDITVDGDILTYYIDEWASDYDVMVNVMNVLEGVGVESEPFFEDGDAYAVKTETDAQIVESSNEEVVEEVESEQVEEDDDIMIIADDGVVIRVEAKEISKIGRNTKGVRIMKMKEGSKIVCVAVTKSEKSESELAESIVEEEPVMVEADVVVEEPAIVEEEI